MPKMTQKELEIRIDQQSKTREEILKYVDEVMKGNYLYKVHEKLKEVIRYCNTIHEE